MTGKLATDRPLLVEFRPYDGGAAVDHRAVDLRVRLVPANGGHATIAGSRLLAL